MPTTPPTTAPATRAARAWPEYLAVAIVLALFFEVGVNGIGHQAYMGQDFYLHVKCTLNLLDHPDQWFAVDTTNRPLLYWLGGLCHRLSGGTTPFALAALACVVLNAAALALLHESSRRFIASPVLRVAALALIAFLPATLNGTVVYAADAVTMLPFVLLAWSLLRCTEAGTRRAVWGWALLAGAALTLGNFAKFTFIVLPPAVLVIVFLLWRWQRISRECALALALLAGLQPLLTGWWLHEVNQREVRDQPARHEFNWHGTGEMTWSSLLLVKPSDARIFNAPGYWDHSTVKGALVLPLLENNNYSYPALLQLGLFTDVTEFSRRFVTGFDTPRPSPQQDYARWAVRTGLLFSLPGLLALLLLVGRTARGLSRAAAAPPTGPLGWGLLGLAWFLPLVLILPFLHHAYEAGYWLPRLVLPALWGFGLVLYAAVEARVGHSRRLVWLVALLTALQVWLQVRGVWF